MAHNLLVPQADALKIECRVGIEGYTSEYFFVKACNAINIGATPTDEEVCNEARRLWLIQHARNRGGVMSQELYSDAVIRHHKVVNARLGMGNDAMPQAILAGQQQIKARLDAVEAGKEGPFN